jgi:DMSO reductase family type II enzyme chaperone
MSADESADRARSPESLATERSRAYQIFCTAIAYPEDDLCEAIRAGTLSDALRTVLTVVDESLVEGVDWAAFCDAGEGEDDLAVEFSRLFDVGSSGPPCPLYGGLYAGARMKTMEEAVRFYNHFGLTLSDDPRELPDHLTTQLEFLHYLGFREAQALAGDDDPGAYQRAQRDFVARHPGRWVPKLRERVEDQAPAPYFGQLVALLDRFLASEMNRLSREVGAPDLSTRPSAGLQRPSV